MNNSTDFKLSPEDLFLNPAKDQGLTFLTKPDYIWRAQPPAVIKGFAASAHSEINERIDGFTLGTEKHKAFSRAIEFNTVPVFLEDAWFKKSYVTAAGKYILSGASAMRLQNRYCWKNEGSDFEPEQKLIQFFQDSASDPENAWVATLESKPKSDLGFAIECRNTFNYYHFMTESLCQLCLVEESGVQGPIFFHFPNQTEKTRRFTMDFIEVLFPELANRVRFEKAPYHHDSVIGVYNFSTAYYQLPPVVSGSVDEFAPSDLLWKGRVASRNSQAVLSMNSYDSSLVKLRKRALDALIGKDFSHLPKRFWVGRDAGQSRHRRMEGEESILEMLSLFDFKAVAFENHSPLEQIALMANAEMMVSYHGAGFTNMLFANPDAYVVELGTLQTALFRWGDFWKCAHIAGCRYISFFADYNKADQKADPRFALDGIVPVSLSQSGLAQVMSFIVTALGSIPTFNRADDVARLGWQMIRIGAYHRALQLFEKHSGMQEGSADLCLAIAECHEKLGNHNQQLTALFGAYRADSTRWGALVQVIWCARKMNDHVTIRAALAVLREAFPDRYDSFVKDRPWFRKLS